MRPPHAPSRSSSLSNWILLFLSLLAATTPADANTPLAPGAPYITSRTTNSVSLSWSDASDNESSFRVDFRPASSLAPWSPGPAVPANTTAASVSSLTPNTTYEFRVLALNGSLASAPSASTSVRTLSSPDEPAGEPYNLAVTRIFHNSITLSWSDNASNDSGFRVLRSLSPDGPSTSINLGPNSTSYTDNNLAANTSYFYRVQAFNGTFDADPSIQISTLTLAAPAAPAAPSSLAVTSYNTTSARLIWADNSTNEDAFAIDQFSTPPGTWITSGQTDFNVRSFILNGLTPGTTYTLRVRATNATGSSTSNAIVFSTLKVGGDFSGLAQQSGSTYTFAFSSPNRLERYNLASRSWLTPIPLSAAATALWIDQSGIYAAEGRNLIRWNPDGTNRSLFYTSPANIISLFAVGNVLATCAATATYTNLDKSSGLVLASFPSDYPPSGISFDPTLNRIFARSTLISPSRLLFLDFGPDGKLLRSANNSAYSASRTFIFPGGGRVADDSGSVYSTENLDRITSLGAALKDLVFLGSNIPIVLRGNRLSALTNTFTETGSFTLSSSNGTRVALSGSDALVFSTDNTTTHGISVQSVPLAALNTPEPDQPIIPDGLAFSIDEAFADKNGDLLLLSAAHLSVFRWSPSLTSYTATFPLARAPTSAAYSPTSHRLFSVSGSNAIRQLDFTQPSPAESIHSSPPSASLRIAAAGDLLFTSGEQSRNRPPLTWDPINRRIYYLDSPVNIFFSVLNTSGNVTGSGSSPLGTALSIRPPLRISDDSAFVALGSGEILHGFSLMRVITLPVTATDMTWKGRTLFSIEPESSTVTRLQRWSSTWQRDKSIALGGSPLRILSLPSGGFAVITLHSSGVPRFHLLDENLTHTYDSIPAPPAIVRQPQPLRVKFGGVIRLDALVSGSPPLSLQWHFNDSPIPGATTATYEIPAAGSRNNGTYRLTVSSGSASVSSASVPVTVGPVTSQGFAAGSLLVSAGGALHEYTPGGSLVRSITVPFGPGFDTHYASSSTTDVAIDSLGVAHVGNQPRSGINRVYHLSSYDPANNSWRHTPVPNMASQDFNFTISGDWITASRGRYHQLTREWHPYPLSQAFSPDRSFSTSDGRIFGFARYNYSASELHPSLGVWNPPVPLPGSFTAYGFTIDDEGNFITCTAGGVLTAYSPTGSTIRSIAIPPGSGSVIDLDIRPDGTIAIGHDTNFVTVVRPGLVAPVRFPLPNLLGQGTFVTWVPATAPSSPAFSSSPPPPATENSPWQWSPTVSHPDPDAVLSISAVSLPPWLQLENGSLSGTPLASHLGTQSFRLKVTDAFGISSEQSFSVSVAEVNDAPVAGPSLLVLREEDAPDEEINLASRITDEETDSLAWSIVSSSGSVVTTILNGERLLLRYLPNAHGSARIILRATDAGGLSAETTIALVVSPVNDPPVIPAAIPDVAANDAGSDALIDFSPLVSDPDAGDVLTWRVIGNTNPALFSELSFDPQGRLTIRYAPYVSGEATITVSVSDAAGTVAQRSFKIVLPALPPPSVTTQGTLTLNRQTGLWEHRVTIRNIGQRAIGGFEIHVAGLPANASLYNASDCLTGLPCAIYHQPVAPGQSVSMVLEYYVSDRRPLSPPTLTTVPILPHDVSSPATSGSLAIDVAMLLKPGMFMIEFPSEPGVLYQIQYSDDGTRWLDSLSRIRAAGTRTQWIDQGAPRTASPPGSATRFYRVKRIAGS